MKSQIKLGKIFGIDVGLHYSWFLIALLIPLSLSSQLHSANQNWSSGSILAAAILMTLLFFISLLLHELAHSLVATHNNLPVKEITLFALGGVSRIEGSPASAKIEFWMAFVGPLTSAIIGLFSLFVAALIHGHTQTLGFAVFQWLGIINLSLAAFNLIPGYPLDGGRVLRAIVWWKTGDADRSTKTAARIGEGVAFLFIAGGMYRFFTGAGFGGLWIAFIGWFLLQAARESYVQAGLSHVLQGVRVADVMRHDCVVVDGYLNVQNFVEQLLLHTSQRCFAITENGEISGVVTPEEIKHIERAKWPYMTLHDIMQPLEGVHAVDPAMPLSKALEEMSKGDLEQLPVVSHGHLEGVLSRSQVFNFLQTRMEFSR